MQNSVFVSLASRCVWQQGSSNVKNIDVIDSSFETWEEAQNDFERKRETWQLFANRHGLRTVNGESSGIQYFDVLDGEKVVCNLEIWPTPNYFKELDEMDLPF